MKSEITSSMVEVLTPIWQRVLQLSSVQVDDDFFDLGGDSSLALQLFNEIATACGRELPPVTIYQARTIAALAALLDQTTTPRFPALVLLRPGANKIPVFLAHGLGGSVIDFFQPVRHIESDHPIYGLQSRGIDGLDEPPERIEDMAEFYLQALREVQPCGPYILIGYSLGGLVALEMAQRLTENGEEIALLCMIDAYPRYLPLGQRIRLAARQAGLRLRIFGNSSDDAIYQPPPGIILTPAMKRVRESASVALTRYRPRYYRGKVKFVRAAVVTGFPADAEAVWRPLVEKIEVETCPGDHLGMIATHYDHLASVLSRYLSDAFTETRVE